MRLPRCCLASLACVVLLAAGARAAPPDPLRLVPGQAELIVEVKNPRRLVEAFTTLDLVKQAQAAPAFQDLLETANVRPFFQLVAHFEKQLGASWPELLDRVAGGGLVLAVRYGSQPPPALLIIQGTDEAAVHKFARLALEVIEQEVARQEGREQIQKASYRGIETVSIGKEFRAAVAGAALIISNSDKALQRSLDLHHNGGRSMAEVKGLAEARRQLPPDPLAFAWLDMDSIRRRPRAKEVLTTEDANVRVFLGSLFSVLRRTPHLLAGLYREENGFVLTTRAAAGREGMGPEVGLHVPPADQPGTRPLLEPKGVLFSSSSYFNLAKIWEEREKLFNKEQVKALEAFDQTSARFLSGNQLSKLLLQTGPYQRFVVVNQPTPGAYQTAPKIPLPAFALVQELREPEPFARSVNTIVRGAALLAGTRVRLQLMEEKHGEHEIVGYRFDEKAPVAGDVNGLRFNFSPCFACVGNQIVFCSTLELCHELVDLLEKEAKDAAAQGHRAASVSRLYFAGGAGVLKVFEDALIAQAVLEEGVGLAEARKQLEGLIELVRRLGVINIESAYGVNDFRLDVRLRVGK